MLRAALWVALTLPTGAFAQTKDKVQERIAAFEGSVSLYAKNLETGTTIGIRESEPVRTASTIKLPIMLAVFDAVARGKAKWNESLTVAAADKVSGSGILGSEVSDGVQLPLKDVLNLMIVLSDKALGLCWFSVKWRAGVPC
jgi:beta-lactamase class A